MFERVVSVLEARNSNDWDLADALLVEVPAYAPLTDFDMLAEELERRGLDYKAGTLRKYRDTAKAWKPSERMDGVSFTAHREGLRLSSDPETRGSIMREIETMNGRVTVPSIKARVLEQQGKDAPKAPDNVLVDLVALVKAAQRIGDDPNLANRVAAEALEPAAADQWASSAATLRDLARSITDGVDAAGQRVRTQQSKRAAGQVKPARPKAVKPAAGLGGKVGGLGAGRGE